MEGSETASNQGTCVPLMNPVFPACDKGAASWFHFPHNNDCCPWKRSQGHPVENVMLEWWRMGARRVQIPSIPWKSSVLPSPSSGCFLTLNCFIPKSPGTHASPAVLLWSGCLYPHTCICWSAKSQGRCVCVRRAVPETWLWHGGRALSNTKAGSWELLPLSHQVRPPEGAPIGLFSKQPSPDTKSTSTLIWSCPVCSALRNTFLWLISHPALLFYSLL